MATCARDNVRRATPAGTPSHSMQAGARHRECAELVFFPSSPLISAIAVLSSSSSSSSPPSTTHHRSPSASVADHPASAIVPSPALPLCSVSLSPSSTPVTLLPLPLYLLLCFCLCPSTPVTKTERHRRPLLPLHPTIGFSPPPPLRLSPSIVPAIHRRSPSATAILLSAVLPSATAVPLFLRPDHHHQRCLRSLPSPRLPPLRPSLPPLPVKPSPSSSSSISLSPPSPLHVLPFLRLRRRTPPRAAAASVAAAAIFPCQRHGKSPFPLRFGSVR